jgi:ATP-dependent DNA helicase RecG
MNFKNMSDSILNQEIQFLPGVGPKRAELLNKELSIYTFEDLLFYFPYKYVDKTKYYSINEIHPNLPYIQVKGKITGFRYEGPPRKQRLVAGFTDGNGIIELIWFKGTKWIHNSLDLNTTYIVYGKPGIFKNKINIIHPEIEDALKKENTLNSSFQAFYNTTEKLKNNYITSRTIHKLQNNLLSQVLDNIHDTLPEYLIQKYRLLPLRDSILNIHYPENTDLLEKATFRLKFEELFYIQLNILKLRSNRMTAFKGYRFPSIGDHFNQFYKEHLPFELTTAQKRVLKEIRKDLNSGIQMNRLLQGDVGSGKTLVALMSMLIAADNTFQACLMAPTEILASQHYQTLLNFLTGMDINIKLLTGSTKKTERTCIIDSLQSGELHILVGTHALLEDPVQFRKLGLVIIDEQHRFGVAQRAKLWQKNPDNPPHVLVMTATPIPRTLAMTLYGDLDVSVIDEMPPGRKPVITRHYYDSKRLRMFGFIREQIQKGQQIYVVYPLIKESEKMDYKDLEDGFFSIKQAFPPPEYHVCILHGKMKTGEKDTSMQLFRNRKAHIMVATTVIEVGVDVPNATVMVVESAERFGLSQLHQLRGRVGRGGDQSYCILMSGNKLSDDAKKRIGTMVKTNDGFEIAEVDLQIRGPGDIEGTQQSGIPYQLKIAHLGKDSHILQQVRRAASIILENDPDLVKPDNQILNKQLQKNQSRVQWRMIS